MTVQPDLCRTWSETTLLVFPRGGSHNSINTLYANYLHQSDFYFSRKLSGTHPLNSIYDENVCELMFFGHSVIKSAFEVV